MTPDEAGDRLLELYREQRALNDPKMAELAAQIRSEMTPAERKRMMLRLTRRLTR